MVLKYGYISDQDVTKGMVKVNIAEEGSDFVTGWLSVIVGNTLINKMDSPFDTKEEVVCLMDEHCDTGVCIGAKYSGNNSPASGADPDTLRAVFSYGNGSIVSTVSFSRKTSTLTVDNNNHDVKVIINGGQLGGMVKIIDLNEVVNTLQKDINTLKTAFSSWVVTPQDGGAALKSIAGTWFGNQLTITQQSDIEDTNVKH